MKPGPSNGSPRARRRRVLDRLLAGQSPGGELEVGHTGRAGDPAAATIGFDSTGVPVAPVRWGTACDRDPTVDRGRVDGEGETASGVGNGSGSGGPAARDRYRPVFPVRPAGPERSTDSTSVPGRIPDWSTPAPTTRPEP